MNSETVINQSIIKNNYGYYEVRNKPRESELNEYYSKKYYQDEKGNYSHFYNENDLKYFSNKIEQKFWIIEDLFKTKNHDGKKLLDIGCGEGFTLKYFSERNWEVLGLDYSNFGCGNINPQVLPNLKTGDIYQTILQLIKDKEKFDVIWLSNILEHVIDPKKLLEDCKSLSNENTVLVIQVPNDFSIIQNNLLETKKVESEFWVALPDHLSYFNAEGLNNLCSHVNWGNHKMITDFPIDLFLMNDSSNYIKDKSTGKNANNARIEFENLFHEQAGKKINDVYESMASVGLGRQITGFYKMKI